MRGIEGKTTVMNTITYYQNIVLPDLAQIVLHLISKLAGLEDDNFKVVRPVNRNRIPAVQDKETNVDGIRLFLEWPDVETLAADLPTDKRIRLLPRQFALCQHNAVELRMDYTLPTTAGKEYVSGCFASLKGEFQS